MNYLDKIAEAIRIVVSPDKLPDADTSALFRIYAVLALAKGSATTLEDVHNAWSAWMIERNPSHESIRPFDELDTETQLEDQPYLNAIKAIMGKSTR